MFIFSNIVIAQVKSFSTLPFESSLRGSLTSKNRQFLDSREACFPTYPCESSIDRQG